LRARLAGVLFRRGNYSEALVALNAALPLLIVEGAANDLAAAYNLLGNVSLMRGDLDDARLQYERALDLYRTQDDLWGMAVCYNNLGNVCWCGGQLIAARDFYEQSLALREQMGDPGGAATVYTGLASTYWQMGELAEAHRCADLAIRLAEQVGRVESTVLAHIEQANLLETEGDWPAALARLEQAHTLARRAESTFLAGRTGLGMAQVHLRRGDLAAAQAELVTWGPHVSSYAELVQLWLLISAEVALATTRTDTALGLLTQVAAAAEQYQARFTWCRAERLLGELALRRQDPAAAVAHARRARTMAEKMPAWIELAQALDLLARCYEAAPDQPGALPPTTLLAQAASILEECGPTRFLAPLQARLAAWNSRQ
jgi:tetratricopeptide (TPR) repeat protein